MRTMSKLNQANEKSSVTPGTEVCITATGEGAVYAVGEDGSAVKLQDIGGAGSYIVPVGSWSKIYCDVSYYIANGIY